MTLVTCLTASFTFLLCIQLVLGGIVSSRIKQDQNDAKLRRLFRSLRHPSITGHLQPSDVQDLNLDEWHAAVALSLVHKGLTDNLILLLANPPKEDEAKMECRLIVYQALKQAYQSQDIRILAAVSPFVEEKVLLIYWHELLSDPASRKDVFGAMLPLGRYDFLQVAMNRPESCLPMREASQQLIELHRNTLFESNEEALQKWLSIWHESLIREQQERQCIVCLEQLSEETKTLPCCSKYLCVTCQQQWKVTSARARRIALCPHCRSELWTN